ncbi:50S ribosomal protein L35 [Saccharopolyspora halophila]
MPKNKTHKGTAKRFKVTGKGKLRREQAGRRHILEKKSSRVTRRLEGTEQVSKNDAPRVNKLLGR